MNRFKKAVRKVQIGLITKKIYNLALVKLQQLRDKKEAEPSVSDMSIFEKIFFILDLPFVYVKKITIPPAEENEYNKIWYILH